MTNRNKLTTALAAILSSTDRRPASGGFLLVRPQPAVMLPSRLNARITIGEFGTLLGLPQIETQNAPA